MYVRVNLCLWSAPVVFKLYFNVLRRIDRSDSRRGAEVRCDAEGEKKRKRDKDRIRRGQKKE
jgi:hypothetical protein